MNFLAQRRIEPAGGPDTDYDEVIKSLTKEAREYLCYLPDSRLFISKTHRFNALVSGFENRLKRLKHTYRPQYVDLAVITQMWQQQEGTRKTSKTVAAASGMQYNAKNILSEAVNLRSSDIHIRNRKSRNRTTIHMRIHGDLEQVAEHPYEWGDQLCTTIYQAMTDVSAATFETVSRQDARISARDKLPEGIDGVRVATTPSADGYIMVLRLLYNDTVESHDLSLLGYAAPQVHSFELMKHRPSGINVIAGPTGSGKSTTLQRTLGAIIKDCGGTKHVITVEDPPEYTIEGAVQTAVDNAETEEDRSRCMQSAIKAAVRLDPDVVMIGEIRDAPSARLAVQAAMTGHQVWTTVHAISALNILDRLRDLGVPLENLTDHSIFTGLTCQRLVKLLCPHCRLPLHEVMDRYSEAQLRRVMAAVPDIQTVYVTGSGCDAPECRGGTIGRTVVAETIITDAKLMSFIRNQDRIGALNYWKQEQQGWTMLRHAIDKVSKGIVDPFAAEVIVGPLNMDIIEQDHRIDQAEVSRAVA